VQVWSSGQAVFTVGEQSESKCQASLGASTTETTVFNVEKNPSLWDGLGGSGACLPRNERPDRKPHVKSVHRRERCLQGTIVCVSRRQQDAYLMVQTTNPTGASPITNSHETRRPAWKLGEFPLSC